MFFPEPAHFEQQDIEMQLLKNISKKQLGEECALSRAAPKPPGAVELGCPCGVPAQACFAKQVLVLQAAPLPLSTVFPQILTSSGPFPGSHTVIPTLVPPLWKGLGGLGSLASCSSVFKGHLFSSSGRLSGGTGGNRAASLGQTAWNSAAGSGLALPSWQRQGAGTSRVPPRLDAWGCSGCPGMLRVPRDAPVWDPQGCSGLGPEGMLRFRAGDGADTSACPGAGALGRMRPLKQQR